MGGTTLQIARGAAAARTAFSSVTVCGAVRRLHAGGGGAVCMSRQPSWARGRQEAWRIGVSTRPARVARWQSNLAEPKQESGGTTVSPQASPSSSAPAAAPLSTKRSSASPDNATGKPAEDAESWQLTLLYDGECPLCLREVAMLRRRSASHGGTLRFVDIAADDYDAAAYGVDYATAMGRIHGVRRDGAVIAGVPVFREAYAAVGLGWVYAVTRVPLVGWVVDRIYDFWAARRLQWTGRPSLDAILRARERDNRSCR